MADEPTAKEIHEAMKKVERQMLPETLADLDRKTPPAELAECRATFEACPDPEVRALGLKLVRRVEKRKARIAALLRLLEQKQQGGNEYGERT